MRMSTSSERCCCCWLAGWLLRASPCDIAPPCALPLLFSASDAKPMHALSARSFGGAGLHTLTPTADQQTLSGSRDRDGDQVTATLVG